MNRRAATNLGTPAAPASATRPPAGRDIATPDQVADLQRMAGNAATAHLLIQDGRPPDQRASTRQLDEQRPGGPTAALVTGQAQVQRADDDQTPEEEFLDDLESGIEKAQEYLGYIPTAVEWWGEVGGDMPAGLAAAADNLAKISERISEGVERFGGLVGKARKLLQIKRWAESAYDFAQATRALNLQDKASRDAWIKSTERFAKATKPFVDAAKDWLKGLAMKGGHAASRAFVALQIVTAYGEVGWAALNAGIKNVEAYTSRLEREMRKIDEHERGRSRPPEPPYPGDWSTASERRTERRALRQRMEMAEKARKRRERLAPYRGRVQEAKSKVEQSKRRFDEGGFTRPYMRRRERLMYRVSREMRYGKMDLVSGTPGQHGYVRIERGAGARWWEQFIDSGAAPSFDEIAGVWVDPKKQRVSRDEAQFEIDNFRGVRPSCPFFDEIYHQELDRFSASDRAALKVANEQYLQAAAVAD